MIEIINIPTPEPNSYEVDLPAFKNIAVGKAIQRIPPSVMEKADLFLNPPGPQQIIDKFLNKVDGLLQKEQEAVTKPALKIPANNNTMTKVGGTALNGSPMFSNLEISSKTWTEFSGELRGYRNMVFDTVIISVQQAKNIVQTGIQGNDDGAVIEYSSLNNYNVVINIIITSGINGRYPQEVSEELIRALEAPVTLKVSGWWLLMFNIQELAVTSYDMGQIEGGISQQAVTIYALSSKKPTLVIQ